MKLTARLSTVLLATVPFLTGCWVESQHPFYEAADVITDSMLAGKWVGDGELKNCLLAISLTAGDKYVFELTEKLPPGEWEGGGPCDYGSPLEGKVFHLAGQEFLDVLSSPADANSPALETVLKMEATREKLTLTPLDPEWIADAIRQKRVDLDARIHDNGDGSIPVQPVFVTLTSPTTDLRDFLSQYANDERAFSRSNEMHFHRSK